MEILVAEQRPNPDQLLPLGLTPREAQVLFWIAHGKSNSEIGLIIGCSTSTVGKHIEKILAKLKVENRTAAAAVALRFLAKGD